MKIKNIIALFCLLGTISCSGENEMIMPKSESLSAMQVSYEQSKELTFVHNKMLDFFYKQALSDKLKFSKPLSDEEVEEFVTQFVYSIEKQLVVTRAGSLNGDINVEQVIRITQMNDAIGSRKVHTRSTEPIDNISYLDMFCDEFYNVESGDITPENVDLIIKSILAKIMMAYPDLSEEQIKKLAFVSSLTYNSYNYWYTHAVDWYMDLKENTEVQTRGFWRDLWGAVKSGTQKWAYADTKGAVAAMTGTGFLGKTVAPATALAGAAVGSTIGAIENFFN